jgi:hypothetical protein
VQITEVRPADFGETRNLPGGILVAPGKGQAAIPYTGPEQPLTEKAAGILDPVPPFTEPRQAQRARA